MAICLPCVGLGCDKPADLATGIDSAIYSAIDYSFIVQCPPLCFCPPGLFPQTISILQSTIPPVIPPINESDGPIILRLQGCISLITRTLDATASQTDIATAAQSMQAEWAGQQAQCLAMLVPGVNCQKTDSIDVCNDPFSFVCSYTGVTINIPAGVRCQTISTVGLTPSQIAAAIAAIKANLNQLVQDDNCVFGHFFCGPTTVSFPGGGGVVSVVAHNTGPSTFDTSSFQLLSGAFTGNSVTPSVASGATNTLISVSPITAPFTVKYKGIVIFSGDSSDGRSQTVLVTVCNPS